MTNASPGTARFSAACDQQTAQASSESKTATTPTSTTSGLGGSPIPTARPARVAEVDGALSPGGEFRVHIADAGELPGQKTRVDVSSG